MSNTIVVDGKVYELKRDVTEIEMVDIPAGKFIMGSPESESGRFSDEGPQHEVSVNAFRMSKFAVTFDEYDYFCEQTGKEKPSDSGFGRGRRPVINVSWNDANEYCAWLSEETGRKFRLPTEEEWEYACRAGSQTAYHFGDFPHDLGEYAVYNTDKTAEVGTKKPNAWGLYDMHGNVWEWTSSAWTDDYSHKV